MLQTTNNNKKKRTVIAPLVITVNPGNPKFNDWIKSEISILHEDPSLKKLFPEISVVTRPNRNIKRMTMKNKYTRKEENPNKALPPPGNYRHHHPARCVCFDRMEDDQTKDMKRVRSKETLHLSQYTRSVLSNLQ